MEHTNTKQTQMNIYFHDYNRNTLYIVKKTGFKNRIGAICKSLMAPIQSRMCILEAYRMHSHFWSQRFSGFCRNVVTDSSGNGVWVIGLFILWFESV